MFCYYVVDREPILVPSWKYPKVRKVELLPLREALKIPLFHYVHDCCSSCLGQIKFYLLDNPSIHLHVHALCLIEHYSYCYCFQVKAAIGLLLYFLVTLLLSPRWWNCKRILLNHQAIGSKYHWFPSALLDELIDSQSLTFALSFATKLLPVVYLTHLVYEGTHTMDDKAC